MAVIRAERAGGAQVIVSETEESTTGVLYVATVLDVSAGVCGDGELERCRKNHLEVSMTENGDPVLSGYANAVRADCLAGGSAR